MDTNLGMKSSCLLPRWDYHADGHRGEELFVPYVLGWATFVNCSQEINDARYNLVRCLSTIDSFIYVLTGYNTVSARNFKPSCGYLAMTPLGGTTSIEDASYEDVVEVMRKGFPVSFPIESYSVRVKECLAESIREFYEEPRNITVIDILFIDFDFWFCVFSKLISTNVITSMLITTILSKAVPMAMWCLKIMLATSLLRKVCLLLLKRKNTLLCPRLRRENRASLSKIGSNLPSLLDKVLGALRAPASAFSSAAHSHS
ncbi:hypothetical protein EJB05_31897, partial [Eragrostis curvula]